MNRFALLSLYRSLTRHKLYAALNIGGLAIGIAVFIVLGLYVRFETSFETWLPHHNEIYAIQSDWKDQSSPFAGRYVETMGGLLDELREDFPDLVGTRIMGGKHGGIVQRGNTAVTEDVAMVDPSFFEVFDLPMISGDKDGALAKPDAALISESAAKRYFGQSDPVGQTLRVSMWEPKNYRVAGVFKDLPDNSDFTISVLIPLPENMREINSNWHHWGNSSLQTYLRFRNPAAAARFDAAMPALIDRRGRAYLGDKPSDIFGLVLLPVTDMHLEPNGNAASSAKMTLVTLGLVGTFALLIALINYINLATARAGLRAREVAMRKVLGADRRAVMRQFLAEAMLMVALASLLGLILAELGLPLINAAGGLSLTIPYALVVPALVLLTLVAGFLAGIYPALVLSRYQPAAVLASSRSPGGGRAGTRVREALVVLQFGLAIAFLIGTGVLVAQTQHVRNADTGFQREGLMTVMSLRDSQVDPTQSRAFIQEVRALPNVRAAALANTVVGGSGTRNADNVPLPGVPGDGPLVIWEIVGPDFFEVYAPRLIAGRLFDGRTADDRANTAQGQPDNVLINRQAVGVLGFDSPDDAVGKTVGGDHLRTTIGVVDNLSFFGPRAPTDPTIYYYYADPLRTGNIVASIRFTGDPRAFHEQLEEIWQKIVPQVPFDAQTADEQLIQFYEDDERATRLFAIGAGFAVLIGMVGLWGLASFNTARRVKEIGIRKSLGASATDIVKLLVGQFMRPVLIANLIAWPLAYFAMRTWLAGFDDRIALSPLYFVGASLVAIAIAVLTVLGQSLRASRTAPAWALRHD
ncbi:ABC transporter permease [Altericroceibacterium endophyticum]|uniref:FtsX-like permease family protein n=1 Tax=Altericroceibacterium endophyticum TaxID=1808508 RepID=A0A6I4T3S5_9SPHN|nr:ABC transporter permease [Altericroceibacterium endophyticum]MXO64791.1 FtsX-like permease family protein [Altericroceibacterium endophyticum]